MVRVFLVAQMVRQVVQAAVVAAAAQGQAARHLHRVKVMQVVKVTARQPITRQAAVGQARQVQMLHLQQRRAAQVRHRQLLAHP